MNFSKITHKKAYEMLQEEIKMSKKDYNRCFYHIEPPMGWLNDPNGLCQFNGEYNFFYQYSPFNAKGGLKYWGHYTSKDLVNWTDRKIAIYPDSPYDVHGVYSGTTFIEDGKMNIFYTGNVDNENYNEHRIDGFEHYTMKIESTDGRNFINKKCVIDSNEYPKNYTKHIRDPKIFKHNDLYIMILGARDVEDKGQIIYYTSKDLDNWNYGGVFSGSVEKLGYMWECPDYFQIDNKDILLFSPQGIEKENYKYANVYQSVYAIGKLENKDCRFEFDEVVELDNGFDFYAPQTFEDEKGRRILVGWLGLGDIEEEYYNNEPTIKENWQHTLTIPRELKIIDEKLYQMPVEELKELRKDKINFEYELKDNAIDSSNFYGTTYESNLEFENMKNLKIDLREDTSIIFDIEEKVLKLSHGKSGYGRDLRGIELESLNSLRIFMDNSVMEIFINGGQHVMSSRLYPKKGEDKFIISGTFDVNIEHYKI